MSPLLPSTSLFRSSIVKFVIFFVLARILGPEAYGLLGMAMIVVAFTQIFIVESVGEALIQRKDLEPGHLDAVFWLLLFMAVLLALISFWEIGRASCRDRVCQYV